jgi:hypothetical protein
MTTVLLSAWVGFDIWGITETDATYTFQRFCTQNLWNQYFAVKNRRKPNIPKARQ